MSAPSPAACSPASQAAVAGFRQLAVLLGPDRAPEQENPQDDAECVGTRRTDAGFADGAGRSDGHARTERDGGGGAHGARYRRTMPTVVYQSANRCDGTSGGG